MKDGLLNDVVPGDLIVDLSQSYGVPIGIVFGETKIGRIRYIDIATNRIGVYTQRKTYAKSNGRTIKISLEDARGYIRRLYATKWRDEEGLAAEAFIENLENLLQ